jgi:hypothetical protein
MIQKEDENLEEFVERLQYNLQRSSHPDVSKDILKTILLKGVRNDCLDMLNMLGKGTYLKNHMMKLLTYVKDVQEEMQGIDQTIGIPHFQEFKNEPVEEQQELK